MSDVRDKMLADAIKTVFEYSHTIIKLKRALIALIIVNIGLICGYFFV